VCEKTSDVEHRDRESCCHDGDQEQWKHPDSDDCCAAQSGSISSKDGMLSLGPAVSISANREVCELPIESTAETGREVNRSCGLSGAVPPLTSNDTPSIVQHDNTDCEQFESVVEQGLRVPKNEVKSDDVCEEGVENITGVDSTVSLCSDPVQTGPSQSEIKSAGTTRRPARAAARPSHFRDDQFETQFRPGPKNRVRQMHFNPGKGEFSAVDNICNLQPPHEKQETRERERCKTLGKGEQNGSKLGNSKQLRPVNSLLIQSPNGNQPYLIRKNGFRLGWPIWPKIRFKSHTQNR